MLHGELKQRWAEVETVIYSMTEVGHSAALLRLRQLGDLLRRPTEDTRTYFVY